MNAEELHYYPLVVKLDECIENCNTLNDLSNKACVSNKIRFEYTCKCNSDQWLNNNKC